MECQNTIKNLKINKNKTIEKIVIILEGEEDEFRLLKHIFTKILNYNYISLKRNKVMQHEFISDNKKNTVIIANTRNSNINSIIDDDEYKDKLYNLLKEDYQKNLKNTNVYIIWDRDKDSMNDFENQKAYKKAINTFYSALDNNYEMNGLLLLSYPCYESYNLSNFSKKLYLDKFASSEACKKKFNESKFTIKNINENTLLTAVYNMHHSLLEFNIREYDPTDLCLINNNIYRKQEEYYKVNKCFKTLSLISVMLIDLGIIEINNQINV